MRSSEESMSPARKGATTKNMSSAKKSHTYNYKSKRVTSPKNGTKTETRGSVE
jgi:hypothetical protein